MTHSVLKCHLEGTFYGLGRFLELEQKRPLAPRVDLHAGQGEVVEQANGILSGVVIAYLVQGFELAR